jgi:hypothetical protein
MIYVKDDFLDKTFFDIINSHLNSNEFKKIDVGDTFFYIQESEKSFNDYMRLRLEELERCKLKNVLAFFRQSTDVLDADWRIHSDLNVNGERPDRALVLYLSPKERTDLHGTAFWEHHIYGKELPLGITDKEYNDTIKLDSGDLDKWDLKSVIGYEENRLVSYPANYFHSRYPDKGWEEGRNVFVMFYKFDK